MTSALTITDLSNAKQDIYHIAEIANSQNPTAIDRLGRAKPTVVGAMASLKAFNPRGEFVSGTAYALKDIYTSGGIAYVAVIDHVSSTVAADLAAGKIAVHQGVTREDLAAPGNETAFGGEISVKELRISSNAPDSTFIGRDAGINSNPAPSATNGIYNTFVGSQAGKANTSGYAQTFLGYNAGVNTTTGGRNTFLGYQSGISNTAGSDNVFVGVDAGYGNTESSGSVVIGFHAGLNLNPPAGPPENVIIGYESVIKPSTATLCTIVGYRGGYNLSSGYANTLIGRLTGFAMTTATFNTCVGENAGPALTTGGTNTFLGSRAGYAATTGGSNTYVGQAAGFSSTDSSSNVFLGCQAGFYETAGSRLIIDNAQRASQADARAKALIYGVFDVDTANQYLCINGNFGVKTQIFGANADGVVAVSNGTPPANGPADTVQLYSTDYTPGHTIPSFMCEGTEVLRTAQADVASTMRVRVRINGTVVTLLGV